MDTAQAYGTAETVLGQYWPKIYHELISKLPPHAPCQSWEDNLLESLRRLQSPSLDGFLLHRSSDLLGADGDKLLNWLESLRERGFSWSYWCLHI